MASSFDAQSRPFRAAVFVNGGKLAPSPWGRLEKVEKKTDTPQVSLIVSCHYEAQNISVSYLRIRAAVDGATDFSEMICTNEDGTDSTLDRFLAPTS